MRLLIYFLGILWYTTILVDSAEVVLEENSSSTLPQWTILKFVKLNVEQTNDKQIAFNEEAALQNYGREVEQQRPQQQLTEWRQHVAKQRQHRRKSTNRQALRAIARKPLNNVKRYGMTKANNLKTPRTKSKSLPLLYYVALPLLLSQFEQRPLLLQQPQQFQNTAAVAAAGTPLADSAVNAPLAMTTTTTTEMPPPMSMLDEMNENANETTATETGNAANVDANDINNVIRLEFIKGLLAALQQTPPAEAATTPIVAADDVKLKPIVSDPATQITSYMSNYMPSVNLNAAQSTSGVLYDNVDFGNRIYLSNNNGYYYANGQRRPIYYGGSSIVTGNGGQWVGAGSSLGYRGGIRRRQQPQQATIKYPTKILHTVNDEIDDYDENDVKPYKTTLDD